MAKRTKEELDSQDSDIDVSSSEDEELQEEGIDEGDEMVNIDFDFFNLNPDIDFRFYSLPIVRAGRLDTRGGTHWYDY